MEENSSSKPQTINLSVTSLTVICSAIAALGGGFLLFYNSVCVPQADYLKSYRDTFDKRLEKIQDLIYLNSQSINNLVENLRKRN